MTEQSRPPLRVVRISPRVMPHIGGMEVHVVELTRALGKLGVEQTLVYSDGTPDLPGVESVEIPTTRRFGTMLHDVTFARRFLARLSARESDLVHSHGDALIAQGAARLAERLGVRHIHTVHGGLVRERFRRAVLRAATPAGSTYLAVSEAVGQDLVANGVPPSGIRLRTSGVRSAFLEVPFRERRGVVIGGRLVPHKLILPFVEEWASRCWEGPLLTVFGAGPDEAAIRRIAGTTGQVEFLGTLGEAGLADLFAGASVGLVLSQPGAPAVGAEGSPTIGLEMLAAGCLPMTGGEVGELRAIVGALSPDLVGDVPPGAEQVSETAIRLAEGAHDQLRLRARERIEASYSWDAVARDVLGVYHDVLGTWRWRDGRKQGS